MIITNSTMFVTVISALFPPFALILSGYLFRRLRPEELAFEPALASFSFKIAVPSLLFISACEANLPESIEWSLYGAFYGPLILVFVVTLLLCRLGVQDKVLASSACASLAMQASYSNITIIGIPIVLYLLGKPALVPLMLIIVVYDIILFLMGTTIAELDSPNWRRLPKLLMSLLVSLLTRPITAALIVGLGFNLFGIYMPVPISDGFYLLGQAGIPTALLVIGMKSVGMGAIEAKWRLGLVVCLNLLVLPFLVGYMSFFVFDLPYLQAATLLVAASMPIGVSALIFSASYGVMEREAAAAVVVSNVCFIGTFGLVVWSLELMQ